MSGVLDSHLQRMASTGSVGNVFEWSEFINYVRNLEAETARLQAIIDAAPHAESCERNKSFHAIDCNCWKAETKRPEKC